MLDTVTAEVVAGVADTEEDDVVAGVDDTDDVAVCAAVADTEDVTVDAGVVVSAEEGVGDDDGVESGVGHEQTGAIRLRSDTSSTRRAHSCRSLLTTSSPSWRRPPHAHTSL